MVDIWGEVSIYAYTLWDLPFEENDPENKGEIFQCQGEQGEPKAPSHQTGDVGPVSQLASGDQTEHVVHSGWSHRGDDRVTWVSWRFLVWVGLGSVGLAREMNRWAKMTFCVG